MAKRLESNSAKLENGRKHPRVCHPIPIKEGEKNACRTKQEFKDECNIKLIIKKHVDAGIPLPSGQAEKYGDYSDPIAFQDAMQLVITAQERFAELPSYVRTRFENDPTKLLEFMAVPENKDEALEMGLIPKPKPKPKEPAKKEPEKPVPSKDAPGK